MVALLLPSFISFIIFAGATASQWSYLRAVASKWSYSTKDNWDEEYPKYCAGYRQSPINIPTRETSWKWLGTLLPLKFSGYDVEPTSMTAENNFHTLSVTPAYLRKPRIFSGGLSSPYELLNFHFHWGSDETKGSEHTINTVQYPLELHLVHKLVGQTVDDALETSQGLAVLGIFFELSSTDNPALTRLLNITSKLTTENNYTANVPKPNALSSLLPDDLSSYYRYEGSLTTPVCREVVVWTVFKQPLPVSKSQLEKLRSLKDINGEPVQDNYRNPLPLNGRRVYRSWL
ncbi:carbonic anhydrase alpha, 9-like [Hyalella azteca]|uniref:Carbonic anhydrase n=1 Tax=Hyalella azteca TaxID=294128 RepID=A0A6A0H054_HYAAZ|nr:putative carbonic anhydrase 3 isoform X2 [Hyalella azteca]XP_018025010.1 putative carbonic anhydrase 3 isoform X3 [Hyalella azteca]KAA0193003.1 carbonic anhydrase alpha, 9-like [Hyalella azteca]